MIDQAEEEAHMRKESKNCRCRTNTIVWWGDGTVVFWLKGGGNRKKKMSLDTALNISITREIPLTIIPQEE